MNNPTVAPVVAVEFAGEQRNLKFGFLAYRELGLNPFDPESVRAFQARALDIDLASSVIRAGLLHEYYGKSAVRKGQAPPTIDDIVAELDMFSFLTLWDSIARALGTDEDKKTEGATENPPTA